MPGDITMKKVLVTISLLLLLSLSCEATSPGFRLFKADVFSLEVPTEWQVLKEESLAEFRYNYEEEGKKLYRQRYAGTDDNDSKVPFLCVLHGPDMEAMLALIRMKIPHQEGDYLKQMLTQSKETIKWGIQQGIVKQSFASKLVKLGNRDALYTDLEMANGSRLIGYVIFLPDHPYQVLNATFTVEPGKFGKYRHILEHIPGTLTVTIERQIELRGAKYKLSAEAQKFLMISGESNYSAAARAIIINEPHYDSEGQWNLYKGLEIFINENPGLAGRLVFLAEGGMANEPISVAPLIKAVPNPSNEILRAVIDSYLITGYVAYEWNHRKGIEIIGTEEEGLYKESAARWVSMDENLWPLTVVARNQRIVRTFLGQWKKKKLPVLFVGGMHLHPIDAEEFEKGKHYLSDTSNPATAKILRESHNSGIVDLLQQQRIGYIHLEPVSKLLIAEHQGPSKRYGELFRAQISGNYDGYLRDFYQTNIAHVVEDSLDINIREAEGVTVKSVPKEAAELAQKITAILEFIGQYFGPDFLGPGAREIIKKNGDALFVSKDNAKKIQFHIRDYSNHRAPHVQVENEGREEGKRKGWISLDDLSVEYH
jgi:hypothetical protein